MECISVGTRWTEKVKCGSCHSALKIGPTESSAGSKKQIGLKGGWVFAAGTAKQLFSSTWVTESREYIITGSDYIPPIHVSQSLKNKKVESI